MTSIKEEEADSPSQFAHERERVSLDGDEFSQIGQYEKPRNYQHQRHYNEEDVSNVGNIVLQGFPEHCAACFRG